MKRQLSFGDYVKAAFHVTIPVPGIGGLPVNYLYIGIAVGAAIAYWPFALFGIAGEVGYLMFAASHPRFQAAMRARILQQGKKQEEEGLDGLVQSLRHYRYEYDDFCERCDNSLRIGHDTFTASGGQGMLQSYENNIQQFKIIFARMLRMKEILEDNVDARAEASIQCQIEALEQKIADPNEPEVTRDSHQHTLDILRQRLETQIEIRQQLSHVTAEIERLKQEILLVKERVVASSSSPTALADKITVTAEVVQQHSDWIQNQGQFLQNIEINQG